MKLHPDSNIVWRIAWHSRLNNDVYDSRCTLTSPSWSGALSKQNSSHSTWTATWKMHITHIFLGDRPISAILPFPLPVSTAHFWAIAVHFPLNLMLAHCANGTFLYHFRALDGGGIFSKFVNFVQKVWQNPFSKNHQFEIKTKVEGDFCARNPLLFLQWSLS